MDNSLQLRSALHSSGAPDSPQHDGDSARTPQFLSGLENSLSFSALNSNSTNRNTTRLSSLRSKLSSVNSNVNLFKKKKNFSKNQNDLENQPLLQSDNLAPTYSASSITQTDSIEGENSHSAGNQLGYEINNSESHSTQAPAGNAFQCPIPLYPNSSGLQTSLYIILGLLVTIISIILIITGQFELLYKFLKHIFCDFHPDSPFNFCVNI
ncbi:uncharacterized protein ASCRUDRAFT_8557 [Ascoidea rubescens DSM 1968]|uniref:Uncharacterized protein n=1 Tax=Ascoidea rubescens DSM 1968 TaxID=1344418 RepID=A0A1D2VFA0_9ASCO|nr:hypothetical protein ASCRUDRAFT_8557 [Ascoidea rubescens DSM 1968]ODV60306.1 hypothetical protein ASCRUDRAFT_8557 [Ascoidea rubescens DSM 1968]